MSDEPLSRQDHDQRFKTLLKEFLGPFLELFFPEQARRLDFAHVEWLENEAFPDPPEGKRRSLDVVCKAPLREPLETAHGDVAAGMVVIVHVEVESADTVQPFRKRMFQYFACLRQKYVEPILPVAVYLRVGLAGVGIDRYEERLGDFGLLQYNYLYVGLPALEAEEYLNRPGALSAALAAAMSVPRDRRPETRAESLAHVVRSSENEYRTFLLTEFIESYLPLTQADEIARYDALLQSSQFEEVKRMTVTTFEKGLEAGLKKALIRVMQTRFGAIPADLRERIESGTEEKVSELLQRASTAESIAAMKIDEVLD